MNDGLFHDRCHIETGRVRAGKSAKRVTLFSQEQLESWANAADAHADAMHKDGDSSYVWDMNHHSEFARLVAAHVLAKVPA